MPAFLNPAFLADSPAVSTAELLYASVMKFGKSISLNVIGGGGRYSCGPPAIPAERSIAGRPTCKAIGL